MIGQLEFSQLIANIISPSFAFWLCNRFLTRKYHSLFPSVLALVFNITALNLAEAVFGLTPLHFFYMVVPIIISTIFIYSDRLELKVFAVIFYCLVLVAAETLVVPLNSLISSKIFNNSQTAYETMSNIFVPIFSCAVCGMFTKVRTAYWRRASAVMRWGWAVLCAIFFCAFGFLFYFSTNFNQVLQNPMQIYLMLMVTVSIILLTISFDFSLKQNEDKLAQVAFNSQIEQYKLRFSQLNEQQQSLRKFRHDSNNMITTIQGLAEQGKTNELLQMIYSMRNDLMPITEIAYTYVPSIDVIINAKKMQASEGNTKFDVHVGAMSEIIVNPLFVNIVLSNALDNALEACNELEHDKIISLNIKMDGDYLHIKLVNTSPPRIPDEAGMFNSTKQDAQNHGHGIVSIKSLVEKCDGQMVCNCSDGIFTFVAMLKNE